MIYQFDICIFLVENNSSTIDLHGVSVFLLLDLNATNLDEISKPLSLRYIEG